MHQEHRRKHEIAETVTRFGGEHLSKTPQSVEVAVHSDSVVITFRGASCPAERDYARESQARERLDRVHEETYRVTKAVLESSIERIVDRGVERSRLSVDAESGEGTILISLAPVKESGSADTTPVGHERSRS